MLNLRQWFKHEKGGFLNCYWITIKRSHDISTPKYSIKESLSFISVCRHEICSNLWLFYHEYRLIFIEVKISCCNQYIISVFQLQIIIQLIFSLKHMGNIISPDTDFVFVCGFNNRTNIYRYGVLKIICLPSKGIGWC